MPKDITPAKPFKPRASRARNGISVIFDLGEFSKFFSQPDVHDYIPRYLNHVTRCIEIALFGGVQFWNPEPDVLRPLALLPVHRKFLGDGALYIWTPKKDTGTFGENFVNYLSNRLWNLQNEFRRINKACSDDVPVFELPTTLRIGVARGTIFELSFEKSTAKEYIGICINLASRLQKYCPGLNFLASARLGLTHDRIEQHGYMRVVATKIRGFPKEIVIVDKEGFSNLHEETRDDLFES